MAELIPIVEPLQQGKPLQVYRDVSVGIVYADVGYNDRVQLRWGVALSQSAVVDRNAPAPKLAIPSAQICDGSATVWYSIEDAIGNLSFSTVVDVQIETGTQRLVAPEVTAVDPSRPDQGMAVKVPDSPAFGLSLRKGDVVTVFWVIWTTDGSCSYSKGCAVTGDGTTIFSPLSPAPAEGQYATVHYQVKRILAADPGQDARTPQRTQTFLSGSRQVTYRDLWPDFCSVPAPVFTQAVAGALDLNALAGKPVALKIPATPDIANMNVTFHGQGYAPGSATPIAGSVWDSGNVFVDRTPYVYNNAVPYRNLQTVPDGGRYVVHYLLENGLVSPSAEVRIYGKAAWPAPVFIEEQDGVIDIGGMKADTVVHVRVDSEALSGHTIYFYGFGSNGPGKPAIAQTRWESGPTDGGGKFTIAPIGRYYLRLTPTGGIYTIYYTVDKPSVDGQSDSLLGTVVVVY